MSLEDLNRIGIHKRQKLNQKTKQRGHTHSNIDLVLCLNCGSWIRFRCSKGYCINCCTGFDWEMIPIPKETR